MRLRHGESGVVVNVRDDKQLGAEWEPFTDGDQAPAQSAKKADWVDYAVSQGADRDESEASTKDDLVHQFG